jgi:hypothetical protein
MVYEKVLAKPANAAPVTLPDQDIEMVQVAAEVSVAGTLEEPSQIAKGTAYVEDDDYDDSDDLTECECGRLIFTVLAVMLLIIASLVCLFSKKIKKNSLKKIPNIICTQRRW